MLCLVYQLKLCKFVRNFVGVLGSIVWFRQVEHYYTLFVSKGKYKLIHNKIETGEGVFIIIVPCRTSSINNASR